jgi:uncharacterized phosphosugar-binding protein
VVVETSGEEEVGTDVIQSLNDKFACCISFTSLSAESVEQFIGCG